MAKNFNPFKLDSTAPAPDPNLKKRKRVVVELSSDESSSSSEEESPSPSSSSPSSSSSSDSMVLEGRHKKRKNKGGRKAKKSKTQHIIPPIMATSVEDAMNNILEVKTNPGFELRDHQRRMLDYDIARMRMVQFEPTRLSRYNVTKAPNNGVQGGGNYAEKGMGKTRMMLQLGFQMKRITGPWLLFESKTLFKEIKECLHTHFAPEYHNSVLFFHAKHMPLAEYKAMTAAKLKEYTIIVMTIESYMTMVFDFGFQEESAIYGDMTDGTRRVLGYGQCTYEQVLSREKYNYTGSTALMAVHFDGVIIDESHSIRNSNTNRSIALTTIGRLFNFLFSGDPMVNSSNDLYSQLRFMGYKGAQNVGEWEKNLEYFKKRDNILAEGVESPMMVMTIKKDAPQLEPPPLYRSEVMLDLKNPIEIEVNKTMITIMTNLIKAANNNKISKRFVFAFFTFQNLAKIAPYLITTASKRKNYKAHIFTENGGGSEVNRTIIGDDAFDSYFTEEKMKEIAQDLTLDDSDRNTSVLAPPLQDGAEEKDAVAFGNSLVSSFAPQLMSEAISDIEGPGGMQSTTMQWIVQQVKEIFANGVPENPKIIIGSNFTTAVDLTARTIEKYLPGVDFVQLDGSVPDKKRDEFILRFQLNPICRILLVNTKVGSLGHNLMQSNYVIDADGWYNDVTPNQLIARCWRPGQKYPVHAYQLFRNNTIDIHIQKLRAAKRANIDEFWKKEEPVVGNLYDDDDDTPRAPAKRTILTKRPQPTSSMLDFKTIEKVNNFQQIVQRRKTTTMATTPLAPPPRTLPAPSPVQQRTVAQAYPPLKEDTKLKFHPYTQPLPPPPVPSSSLKETEPNTLMNKAWGLIDNYFGPKK